MTHVYINSGRLIPEGEVDKGIAKIAAEADVAEFKAEHPVAGFVFGSIYEAASYIKYRFSG